MEPFDPFCTANKATQVLPEESARVGDVVVKLTPYVLPHHSHLTAKEHDFYQDRSDFLANQGAYEGEKWTPRTHKFVDGVMDAVERRGGSRIAAVSALWHSFGSDAATTDAALNRFVASKW